MRRIAIERRAVRLLQRDHAAGARSRIASRISRSGSPAVLATKRICTRSNEPAGRSEPKASPRTNSTLAGAWARACARCFSSMSSPTTRPVGTDPLAQDTGDAARTAADVEAAPARSRRRCDRASSAYRAPCPRPGCAAARSRCRCVRAGSGRRRSATSWANFELAAKHHAGNGMTAPTPARSNRGPKIRSAPQTQTAPVQWPAAMRSIFHLSRKPVTRSVTAESGISTRWKPRTRNRSSARPSRPAPKSLDARVRTSCKDHGALRRLDHERNLVHLPRARNLGSHRNE